MKKSPIRELNNGKGKTYEMRALSDGCTRGEPKVASRADPLRNCYIDLLSPLRACDPWAVHSAMTYVKEAAANLELIAVQQKIVEILKTMDLRNRPIYAQGCK
ncbi:MAG: hypothetical protein JSV83_00755 [Desulfobacterales bacterium]|nr:MAG: hypothetical protein JSV83_00755 [Desulfobacterales bacterium]